MKGILKVVVLVIAVGLLFLSGMAIENNHMENDKSGWLDSGATVKVVLAEEENPPCCDTPPFPPE